MDISQFRIINKHRKEESRKEIIKLALQDSIVEGMNLEFGVYKGWSINTAAEICPDRIFYGFDSFKGLPEPWVKNDINTVPAGHFYLPEPPEVRENVKLVIGWYQDTLPKWLEKHTDKISYLHIDSDLYSSAKYILNSLDSQIVRETVILFDDLLYYRHRKPQVRYDNWRDGEYKALEEWLDLHKRKVSPRYRMKSQGTAYVKVVK